MQARLHACRHACTLSVQACLHAKSAGLRACRHVFPACLGSGNACTYHPPLALVRLFRLLDVYRPNHNKTAALRCQRKVASPRPHERHTPRTFTRERSAQRPAPGIIPRIDRAVSSELSPTFPVVAIAYNPVNLKNSQCCYRGLKCQGQELDCQ